LRKRRRAAQTLIFLGACRRCEGRTHPKLTAAPRGLSSACCFLELP
jgi:hypothetical protein